MKYVLIIVLFFEFVWVGLFFVPAFEDKPADPDAISRDNVDMVYRSPADLQAERDSTRRKRLVYKTAMGTLFVLNSAGVIVIVRCLKHQ